MGVISRPSSAAGGSAAAKRAGAAATLLFAAVLSAWAVVTPAYRGPDEPQHLSTVLRISSGGGYPPPGEARMDPAVVQSFRWVEYRGRAGRDPVGPRLSRSTSPSMRGLREADSSQDRGPDQMTQHPPAFYALMSLVVDIAQLEDATPETMILVLRLASACLLLPIPLLVIDVGRRLGLAGPAAAAAAFLPAGWIPFTHLGATINNGGLLVLATSVALALLIRLAQGDVRAGMAAAAGLAVSVALLTKGFALALLLTLLIAGAGAMRRAGRAGITATIIAVVTTAPGLSWWVLNVVRYGEVQPSAALSTEPAAGLSALTGWVAGFASTLSWTMWGALGWAETREPFVAHVLASTLFVIALGWGSIRLRRRSTESWLLHSVWLGSLLIVAYGSAQFFLAHQAVRGVHARYLHTGVVAFCVFLVAALQRQTRLLAALPVASFVLALSGLAYGLRHFWADEPFGQIRSLLTWWPGARLLLAAALLAGTVAAVWGTVEMMRTDRLSARNAIQAGRSAE